MSKNEEVKKSRLKSKMFWAKTVGVIVVLSMFYGFGTSGAAVELEDGKVNLEELQAKIEEQKQTIESKENEIKDVEKELEKINSKFDDRKSEFEEALAVLEDRDSIESEIKSLEDKKSKKQSEIQTLSQEIDNKSSKLESLNGQILKAKGKPIKMNAGQYIVGKDISEGRYKVEPIGSGSNFFVYENEMPIVNTILGSYGEPSYTFFTADGNIIKTESTVKLTPVE